MVATAGAAPIHNAHHPTRTRRRIANSALLDVLGILVGALLSNRYVLNYCLQLCSTGINFL